MRFNTLLHISVAVLILSGFGILLFPARVVSLYGTQLTPGGEVLTRCYGATYLALAATAWAVNKADGRPQQRRLAGGLALGFGLITVIFFAAQLRGVYNALGWFDVILHGSLFAGHLYFSVRWDQ